MGSLRCKNCQKILGSIFLEEDDLDYQCQDCYEAERKKWEEENKDL